MTIARDASPSARRSFVLLAVLVVMLSAMLVATSLLFVAQTEATGATGGSDAAQARALLWSGTQAVMTRLADQREAILAGETPSIESQMVIYETESRAGVVRLLPLGSADEVLVPESGKLDLNRVDGETLARTGVIDAALASAIIAWRDRLSRPVQSVNELLNVSGVTVETLYGSIGPLKTMDAAFAPPADQRSLSSRGVATTARGLADVVTVFSVEPAVQSTGKLQIDLNVQWSEDLARKVEERFGPDAAALLKQVFESGTKFEDDAAIIKALRSYKTPVEDWPAILDAFTTSPDTLRFGRLDLNTASREALMGLPGVTQDQASQIVSMRAELSPAERGSVAWPVLNQVLTPEAFEPLASLVTSRSWTYRVRLAAGEVDADALDGPLTNPLIQELVIDLAGPKPRIAYLRDVTLLQDAALIAAEASRSATGTLPLEPPAEGATSTDDGSARAATTRPNIGRPQRAGPATRPSRTSGASEPSEDEIEASPASPHGSRIGRWTGG